MQVIFEGWNMVITLGLVSLVCVGVPAFYVGKFQYVERNKAAFACFLVMLAGAFVAPCLASQVISSTAALITVGVTQLAGVMTYYVMAGSFGVAFRWWQPITFGIGGAMCAFMAPMLVLFAPI